MTWVELGLNSKSFCGFRVYIILCFNESEQFIKIGKTYHNVNKRFQSTKKLPYSYKVIKEFQFKDGNMCSQFEKKLLIAYSSFKYKPLVPFNGKNECFNIEVLERINER